ncbi:basic helix-loop-helix (bHLH) DNA-binding superfamily protein [Artemisia annua]|uniref:Basic helix-loop-helix (BHLH) DNA-binding superfamily protein n=1 Tax=Artemisia annua TaxID=35608 RepID=A0A2U1ME26_ARTAN|nr:basic helix-loop-helix (bHLH) DNA-binding superfamily protein [Artemisia annua]
MSFIAFVTGSGIEGNVWWLKVNKRRRGFSMLRELIPHGGQKRDKASFLLEVYHERHVYFVHPKLTYRHIAKPKVLVCQIIEYIQFLQKKVHKFEDSCRGWNNEQPAMTAWVITCHK